LQLASKILKNSINL